MALTRVFRLSNSPSLHHCSRTFSTALKHTRVVVPVININRDSKTCSKGLIGPGPFLRKFSTSPVVYDDMQSSVPEDLSYSVISLRRDVELLRTEVSLLSEVVSTIQKCNAQGVVGDKNDGNDSVGVSVPRGSFSEEILDNDSEGKNEKAIINKSDFSGAMATHFNSNIVIVEKMSGFSNTRDNNEKAAKKKSDSSEAMATQDDKAAEKMSDVLEGIQNRDTEGNNENATEEMSNLSELQKSDTEEGNNETVLEGKEQDPLLKEIESEISRAVDFSRVSSQGVNFQEDFPFKLENDVPGVPSITLKRRYNLENIVVTVRNPVFTSLTAKNYQYYTSSNFIMELHVEIFSVICKERDIAFDCFACSTGILIENVYGVDRGDTKGLVFRELNSNLQTEFKKYLEMRGITPSITNIIVGYMLDKVNREKLRSLYKIKELVEA